ncbi:bleomycin resistance protein [Gluconacetobacter takamatsuzukensis]|uniref:Bleomycin resistance protein n=1 Tax=Gluconacetobacter takamatsuzukensis TaxID=1286190 RepID=A0A7W4KEU9_9PROT|nr:bleomycin resistance protein [Gluconacetobacter takamatsuzukensis]
MAATVATNAAPTLSVAARAPFLCSGVAVTPGGTLFLGLPRFPGNEATFSVGRVAPDGTVHPFPGGSWNGWQPGQDGSSAFVMVNAIHIFADGTLWAVDQGAPPGSRPEPGAQKLVQLDTATGAILRVLRFPEAIMPPGAQFNDLRIHGDLLFATDSGLGGIVIHNLKTGSTLRRLSAHPVTRNDATHIHKGSGGRILQDAQGNRPQVQSDDIEVDAGGTWFYFAVPAGPLKKIRVADLLDDRKSDRDLAALVQVAAEIPSIGGTCIDTLGNIYLSDGENNRITILAPDGRRATLVQDPRLVSPDALFIDRGRTLYIPCSQIEKVPMLNGGTNGTHAPFLVLSLPLPDRLGSLRLGAAVEG